jgi:hypothetical protein
MRTPIEDIRRLAELEWAEQAQARVETNLDTIGASLSEAERLTVQAKALHWWQIITRQGILRQTRALIAGNRMLLAENGLLQSRIHDVLHGRSSFPGQSGTWYYTTPEA